MGRIKFLRFKKLLNGCGPLTFISSSPLSLQPPGLVSCQWSLNLIPNLSNIVLSFNLPRECLHPDLTVLVVTLEVAHAVLAGVHVIGGAVAEVPVSPLVLVNLLQA